jgi:hypothetical protein
MLVKHSQPSTHRRGLRSAQLASEQGACVHGSFLPEAQTRWAAPLDAADRAPVVLGDLMDRAVSLVQLTKREARGGRARRVERVNVDKLGVDESDSGRRA